MPPPPPPPPPMGGLAPPPPPPPSFGGSSKASGSGDRSALLSDIHKGLKLKKTVTNDRSLPLVSTKQNTSPSNGPPQPTGGSGSSSARSPVSSGPVGLGGLFTNGIPKLKSTGSKFLPTQPSSSPSSTTNATHSTNSSSRSSSTVNGSNTISAVRNQDLASTLNRRFGGSSKPELPKTKSTWNGPGSLSKSSSNIALSQSSTLKSPSSNKSSLEFEQARSKLGNLFVNNNNNNSNSTNSNNNNIGSSSPSLKADLESPSPVKYNSSAPFPNTNGSSLHKLNNKYHTIGARKSSTHSEQRDEMPAHKGQAPQPPTATKVSRSTSQTSSTARPKINGPKPPSVKPPPPPKSSGASSAGQRTTAPAPPPPPAHQNNTSKPPAPPRGASISEDLSSHGQNNQHNANSLARQQFFEAVATPIPAQPKMGYNHSHSASQTSLNSRTPRPPVGPPPPPPSRGSSVNAAGNNSHDHPKPLKPAPPIPQQIAQLMADGGWTDPVPVPPERGSSRSFTSKFKFAPIASLPPPEQMLNLPKVYSSQLPKTRKHGAPPVPEPPMNGQNNNFLHSAPLPPHQKIHINIQRSNY